MVTKRARRARQGLPRGDTDPGGDNQISGQQGPQGRSRSTISNHEHDPPGGQDAGHTSHNVSLRPGVEAGQG